MKAIYNGHKVKARSALTPGKEYHVRLRTGYKNGQHVLRIVLDDDSSFSYSSIQMLMRDWRMVEEKAPALMDTIAERDAQLEELWSIFGDIPMDPDTERIEEDFLVFPAGTHREEVWHWFDKRYSKGVHGLMYKE
jgi:hypothetical protein